MASSSPNEHNGQENKQSTRETTELPWKFAQCFGEKSETAEVADGTVNRVFSLFVADIISTVQFDRTGDYIASGDRAGRVVLFERNHAVLDI